MPWYDDPSVYYAEPNHDVALSQGDIIMAPTAILIPETGESDVAAPTQPGQERLVMLWRGKPKSLREAPSLAANVRWGLAMVVPHDCALEKDWNERVSELTRDGVPQEEAVAIANADESLDPYVVVAPILTYDMLSEPRHAGTKQGTRLGAFPVSPSETMPASFADFTRMTTLYYRLARVGHRVARLSPLVVGYLKHAIAMYFAFRSRSRLDELENAIGHKIQDIQATDDGRRNLRVSILLESGKTLVLEGDARPVDPAPAPARQPR